MTSNQKKCPHISASKHWPRYYNILFFSSGPSTQTNIERSAPAINELITFEAGPEAPDTITVTFPLTDDNVALEDVERFFVGLTVDTPGSGVLVVQPERTQINVLDDDGETIFQFFH